MSRSVKPKLKIRPDKHVFVTTVGLAFGAVLLGVAIFSSFHLHTATAASSYSSAYNLIPSRLPDDDYDLVTNPCHSDPAPSCTTTNYGYFGDGSNSHQYITLSNDNINDDKNPPFDLRYHYAKAIVIAVYTYYVPTSAHPVPYNGNIHLNLDITDRQVGPAVACHNWVTFHYMTYNNSSRGNYDFHAPGCSSSNDIPGGFPASAFTQETTDSSGVPTHIWKAKMVISYDAKGSHGTDSATGKPSNDTNTQISFHISASGEAKLDYLGGTADNSDEPVTADTPPFVPGGVNGWVNVYPNNAAKGHKIRTYFRPECTTTEGTPFKVAWDDGNEGVNKTVDGTLVPIQPVDQNATVKVYTFTPGDPAHHTLAAGVPSGGWSLGGVNDHYQIHNLTTQNDPSTGVPYAYMVEFSGIYGGNGISFHYPYDSADARIPCPPNPDLLIGWTCSIFGVNAPSSYSGKRYKVFLDSIAGGGIQPANATLNNLGDATFTIDGKNLLGNSSHTFFLKIYDGPGYTNDVTFSDGTQYISRTYQLPCNAYAYSFKPQAFATAPYGGADRPGDIEFYFSTGLTGGPPGNNCSNAGGPYKGINSTTVVYSVYQIHANGAPDTTFAAQGGISCIGNDSAVFIPIPPYTAPPNYALHTDGLTYQAGDQFCLKVDISPSWGVVDANGNQVPGFPVGPVVNSQGCITIINEPIFKVYGSAVSAGGSFDDTCKQPGVLGGWYNNSATNGYGSSSQYVAQSVSNASSNDQIYGFGSGQNSSPGEPSPLDSATGLTFANRFGTLTTQYVSTDLQLPQLGGFFGGKSCLKQLPKPGGGITPDLSGTETVGSGVLVDGIHATAAGTNLKLNSGTIDTGKNVSVFVDGDVYITGDIKYNQAGWSLANNAKNVPSFTLNATGNIYIDPGVTQLAGIYVAKGKIFTCAPGGSVPSYFALTPAYYTMCNNQLTIYGSFVADQVNLMRTYGSMRNDQGVLPGCANQGITTSSFVCAAEVFNFSPEMYLSQPAYNKGGTPVKFRTSLPPVL